MRELKFKGIHPYAKELMDVCLIDWMHDEVYFEQGTDVAYPIEGCKLMQFTGLQDKNGVDIYEGNIVKWGHVDGFEEIIPRIAVVKLDPSLNFETVNLKNNHAFHYGNFAYARSIDKCMEVVGNIHQNPELLK